MEKIENEILSGLDGLVGIDKEIFFDYARYIELKASGDIIDIGNSNFMFKCPSNYLESTRIIETICKLLTYHYENLKYYEITQRDIRHLSEIDADVIIIDAINNLNIMMSTLDMLQEYIYSNSDKIFILIYAEDETVIKHNRTITTVLGDFFSFKMQIGTLTEDDKIKYIQDRLKKNQIKVVKKCNLVDKLANQELSTIDNELLYLAVKCRVNNVNRITDTFLQQIDREQYVSKVKVTNTALKELDALEGLEDVKKQIHSIFNYIRTCKARNVSLPSLHMTFNGPSGVGKTSLARIVGKLFAEEQLLSNENKFTEVHARDLVGQYVGWTAKKVKEIVTKAEGGVLFIDEAYSLCSDRKSFEQEAIDTLIAEMENKRDRLCIILAGYPDEMKELLAMNKGLASRINFHINFESLTPEHLYNIVRAMCKNDGYKLAKNIKPLLLDYFNIEKSKDTFSNGRLARNIADHIKIQQANRVMLETDADINLIIKTDVENVLRQIQQQDPKPKTKIGFAL